jgi:hypothetical protein
MNRPRRVSGPSERSQSRDFAVWQAGFRRPPWENSATEAASQRRMTEAPADRHECDFVSKAGDRLFWLSTLFRV